MSSQTELIRPGDLPTDESDRRLMVRIHEGDPLGALAFIDRYADPLWTLALRTTGRSGSALDLARDVLARAVGDLADRVPRGQERTLVALAHTLWQQLLQAGLDPNRPSARLRIGPKQWAPEALGIDGSAQPNRRRLAQKLRQRLWRAWSALPAQQRFVLALDELSPMALDELASVLGVSDGEARAIRDQARLGLMNALEDRGDAPQ